LTGMEDESAKRRRVLGFAVLLLLLSPVISVVGFVQLMAEGPHGPGGSITGAPGAGVRCIGLNLIAFAVFVLSIRLVQISRRM
jgi:hypothetical protein